MISNVPIISGVLRLLLNAKEMILSSLSLTKPLKLLLGLNGSSQLG
jgi:hypothetical protein